MGTNVVQSGITKTYFVMESNEEQTSHRNQVYEKSMKNYYRILQVDSEAEPEVVDAAYKRLMKKYHPDALSSEQQVNPSLLEKVQEINEAYNVLSDIQKRKAYNEALKQFEKTARPHDSKINPALMTVEKRIYMVRCALSKKTYRMLLARKKGMQSKFKILGFEPAETSSSPNTGGNWLTKASQKFLARPQKNFNPPKRMGFMSDEEIESLFSEESVVSIADVDWTGKHNCPDCGGEIVNPDGIINHWFRCGACSHLYCVGNAKGDMLGATAKCPWCNRSNRIQWNTSKDKTQLILGGREYEESEDDQQKLLSEKNKKALGDGRKQ